MPDNLSTAVRSRVMSRIRSKDTGPELVIRRMIHAWGFRYRLHVRALPGTPDIVLPRHRKIIDVRGCFWHMHSCGRCRLPETRRDEWTAKLERNRRRDKDGAQALRKGGWEVLIVWECEIKNLLRLEEKLRRFLSRSKVQHKRRMGATAT